MVAVRSGHGHDLYQAWMVCVEQLGRDETVASSRLGVCGVLLSMLLLRLELELLGDGLDPDGDGGSPVLDIGLAATGQLCEESRSERVTMFWGLAGNPCLYVDYYGGVEPTVAQRMWTRGSSRGLRWDGRRAGGQEGPVVTMLASGRDGITAYSQTWAFPIQECREDSSKVGQSTKKTRHICSRRFGRRSNEDVSPT